MSPFNPLNGQAHAAPQEALPRFVLPSAYVGLGGYAKAVFPYLDAFLQQHYGGERLPCLPRVLFDFDPAPAEVSLDGTVYSIESYFKRLPKKVLLDYYRKLRRKKTAEVEALRCFAGYVRLEDVRATDAPGLNLFMQGANLAWRLVWQQYVEPELKRVLQGLHPDPQTRSALERQGIKVSPRSTIWVIAGGGSTTGPSGLIPALCALKARKPPQTNLFAIVFTPPCYRDKTTHHRRKGQAIFRATMEQLLAIFGGQEFDQPYSTDGYRISLHEEPFDQLFLVDGTMGGGLRELPNEELAQLVALFLSKLAVGPVGERILGTIIGNLNPDVQGNNQEEEKHAA
jgi:hypothetical protein